MYRLSTVTTCDICNSPITESDDDVPSRVTQLWSVRIIYFRDLDKPITWDLCPQCQDRMFRYLKKNSVESNKRGDPDD